MSTKSENVINNKIESKINNFGITSESKNKRIGEKKHKSREIDEILISGLQHLEQYHKLNPIDIKIGNSQIISLLSKYGKYRPKITSLSINASFNQTTNVIFITCNGLSDAKKALISGKIHNIFGVINLTEKTKFDLIKNRSKGLNIIFKESNGEAKHFSFEVGNLLTFSAGEKKVSVLNFTIPVIR